MGLLQVFGCAYIEGVLLSYIKVNDEIVLVIGFEDKDGNRFITEMKIPLWAYKQNDFHLAATKNEKNNLESSTFENKNLYTETEIFEFLDKQIDKPLIFVLLFDETNLDKVKNKDYFSDNNSKVNYINNLLLYLWKYKKDEAQMVKDIKSYGKIKQMPILIIENSSEMKNQEYDKKPSVYFIYYT